jgi:hypothetical protein
MNVRQCVIAVTLLVIVASSSPAVARRTLVAPESRGGLPNLAGALSTAAAGDTLLLKPGLYRGTYTLAKGVSLVSIAGPDSTILDAAGGRYVFFGMNIDETTTVAGLTIQNGTRPGPNSGGGGFFLYQSSPRILNNIFRGHLGYLGAGVYANNNSNPLIAFNVFQDNEAHLGGAIAAYVGCAPLIYNNVIRGNKAVSGGAILCLNSSPVILRNTILANAAARQGGGAIYLDSSPALIEENVLADNSGTGAIFCLDDDSPPTVRANLFWRNDGGATSGACRDVLGRDGNGEADPGLAEARAGAGAATWDPAGIPEVPLAVLTLWESRRQPERPAPK